MPLICQPCVFSVYCTCCCVFRWMSTYSVVFCPYVSRVTVIRGCHSSAPLGLVYPVIFPSSACALNREGGSVTSLPHMTTMEGGTLFTQTLLKVFTEEWLFSQDPHLPPQPPTQLHISSKTRRIWSLLLTVTRTANMFLSLSAICTHGSQQKRLTSDIAAESRQTFEDLKVLPLNCGT